MIKTNRTHLKTNRKKRKEKKEKKQIEFHLKLPNSSIFHDCNNSNSHNNLIPDKNVDVFFPLRR